MKNIQRARQANEAAGKMQRKNQHGSDVAELLQSGRRMHDAAVYEAIIQFGRLMGKIFGAPRDQGHGGMLPKSRRPHGRAA